MTEFKVTDEAMEAAALAYEAIVSGVNTRALRAALEAALPVMLGEPAAWRYRSPGKSKWRLIDRGPINELMDSESLYRLKEPK